jgi:hypothetical protein
VDWLGGRTAASCHTGDDDEYAKGCTEKGHGRRPPARHT